MTNEEINIAIAEACGWTDITHTAPDRGYMQPRLIGLDKKDGIRKILSNYCDDLNAMREAELTLTAENKLKYASYLAQIFNSSYKKAWWDLNAKEAFEIVNATARQKAEAFLKTLNKWEESPKSARELATKFGIDTKTEGLNAEEIKKNHFVAGLKYKGNS